MARRQPLKIVWAAVRTLKSVNFVKQLITEHDRVRGDVPRLGSLNMSVRAAEGSDASSDYSHRAAATTQLVLVGAEQRGECGAVGGAEFGAGAVEVAFDGADRHDQPLGDLPVG